MKKRLLSAVITAAMLISPISAVSAEDTAVDVLLNGEYVEFADQAPANIDGRVLVPVRAVVEKMGATVDWNEQAKQVEVKKDDVNIVLTVNEPSISVNGTQKALDTAPQVINGRTMLPIRAVAEELGATVGWDSAANSVVIVDWNGYLEEIKTNAPGFFAFMNRNNIIYDNYLSTANGNIGFDFYLKAPTYDDDGAVTGTDENSVKVSVSIASDETAKNGVAKSGAVIKAQLSDLQGILEKFAEEEAKKIDLTKLDEINIDIVADESAFYLNSNIIQKLSDAVDDSQIDALAALVSSDTWLKLEYSKIAEFFGNIDSDIAELVEGYFELVAKTKNSNDTFIDIFLDYMKGLDVDTISAFAIDNTMNTYSSLYGDKYFKYEPTGENAYKVSVKIDKDAYKAMYAELGMEDELVDEIADMMDILLEMNITCDENGNTVSNVKMKYNMSASEPNDDMKMNIGLDMDISSEVKVGAASDDIKAPENSVNIADLLANTTDL